MPLLIKTGVETARSGRVEAQQRHQQFDGRYDTTRSPQRTDVGEDDDLQRHVAQLARPQMAQLPGPAPVRDEEGRRCGADTRRVEVLRVDDPDGRVETDWGWVLTEPPFGKIVVQRADRAL